LVADAQARLNILLNEEQQPAPVEGKKKNGN